MALKVREIMPPAVEGTHVTLEQARAVFRQLRLEQEAAARAKKRKESSPRKTKKVQ